MKRLAVIPAAALALALWASPASAHTSTVSTDTTCVDGQAVVAATFTNDFPTDATVSVFDQAVTLPALGDVTVNGPFSSPLTYTVEWPDEFTQNGTLTPAIPVEGCEPVTLPPPTIPVDADGCPIGGGELVNGPSCPPVPLPQIEASTQTIEATTTTVMSPEQVLEQLPPTLAYTGSGTDLMVLGAGALIGVGSLLAYAAKRGQR